MTKQLKQQLLTALKVYRPDIGKLYLYERCINKYVDALIPAIGAAIAKNKTETTEFFISQSQLREQIGTIGKRQEYIYYLMNSHPTTSLVLVMSKGFSQNGNGRLSSVVINPRYKGLVIQALTTNQPIAKAITPEDESNYTVDVDIDSLQGYITETRRALNDAKKSSAYKAKLFRNLNIALQILGRVQPPDERIHTHYLNERWGQADSGRIYGQGLSLQCTPKEVRHAALGVCHKYDFKACAFAIMASLAHEIKPTLRVSAVLDYIKRRQIIRKQIAEQVGIDESLVKTIFTAIGFGAELDNNPYKAIRSALAEAARQVHAQADDDYFSTTDYQRLGELEYQTLIANQTFAFIYEDFQAINQTILEYFCEKQFEIGERQYTERDPKTGKRRTAKQKLAWIYQALESQAMLRFVDLCQQEPLLTTHDCIYLKKKLSTPQKLDITIQLQETFQYLRFEYEPIFPIATKEFYTKRCAEEKQFEQAHRLHIRREEEMALDKEAQRLSTSTQQKDKLGISFKIK